MDSGALGRLYKKGEVICRQGEPGDCMYVVQKGRVEVVIERNDGEIPLAVRGTGEIIGEMAIFERGVRMATVRALEDSLVLTVDRRSFLKRVHEDPSIAYRLVESMSRRVRELSEEVARLREGERPEKTSRE